MESAEELGKRMFLEHSKSLPRVIGDPLRQGIGTPDWRLANESPGHIAAYSLGYIQELASRVMQCCEDPRETPERQREACQLLVNIATEAAADIHLLLRRFPAPFRAIAETRSNFPCLFPAHPEYRVALGQVLLQDLALGRLHPLKLRSKTGRKTFSMAGYVNKLLQHYLAEIHRIRVELLSFRLNNPWDSAVIPRSEVERLDEEIPLSVANVKPWMDMIWRLLVRDVQHPEKLPRFRKLAQARAARASLDGAPRLTKKRGFARPAKGKKSRSGDPGSGYKKTAIKEMLTKYLIRNLRKGDHSKPDK